MDLPTESVWSWRGECQGTTWLPTFSCVEEKSVFRNSERMATHVSNDEDIKKEEVSCATETKESRN